MTEPETPTPKFKLTKMVAAHGVVRLVASTSVKLVIGTAIAQFVPTETKVQKAKVVVGTYIISGMVQDAAKTYVSNELNDLVEMASVIKAKLKERETKTDPDTDTPE